MNYGTNHSLIGGVIFKGRVKKKYCCVRGGGHYMKNKNIGVCVLSTQPDQQKRPQCKSAKNAKNYQTLKIFSSLVSLTRHYTKFIFLEQLTAMPQFNMQNIFFFSLVFLSSHHDTKPLLHLYHFRKKK